MLINVPEDIAEELAKIAQDEESTIADVLKKLLDRYRPKPAGTLADMARNAREAGLASPQKVDTAKNSREILNREI